MPMTKDSLAALLNGREYCKEITAEEEAEAKANGLLVIFGASDDLTELRGALHDEAGTYGSATLRIDAKGFVPDWDSVDHDDEDACADYFARKNGGFEINAKWAEGDYSWVIETSAPCATFDILDDGEKYCRGIVIDLAEIAS
ncbi:hypothetical protein ABL840_26940 [Variovorax sp. NFACC27]|uniref:hypothetical protein n=1 Tax=unclassified Variovorax TaxID=663243 RepID=UPI00089A5D2D|nr:hypothetical protein SAMN03159371_03661 [Variovorax sp. NFACC28]SEG77836.1 hypothetical protein SAMN03159365_03740 [Variovorax sp. NFACC29]SFC96722.1 hypothetical protein SAMN03159379_03682 [Variovorax sp. NFACC26]SFG09679.1 hypothetical protein SAMN03159447_01791 [Variovorax sp. NFACC27]